LHYKHQRLVLYDVDKCGGRKGKEKVRTENADPEITGGLCKCSINDKLKARYCFIDEGLFIMRMIQS
jgi:hypothetical protein